MRRTGGDPITFWATLRRPATDASWPITPARQRRTRPACDRLTGSAEYRWRPWYRCARSACPACRARSCRPPAHPGARRFAHWCPSPIPPARPRTASFPSSCNVDVYAPLRDVNVCPRSSCSPFISLSVMSAERIHLCWRGERCAVTVQRQLHVVWPPRRGRDTPDGLRGYLGPALAGCPLGHRVGGWVIQVSGRCLNNAAQHLAA